MDVYGFLTENKWEILQQLAKKPQGTKELSEALQATAPHISQQLKQLELAGFVERKKARNGVSRYRYYLAKHAVYISAFSSFAAEHRAIEQNNYLRFLAHALLHKQGVSFLTFFLGKHEVFAKFRAAAVLRRKHPELFVITDAVDYIRKHHSNVAVQTKDGKQKIVIWSHTQEEVLQGLEKKEKYFLELIKQIDITYDPERIIESLQEHYR